MGSCPASRNTAIGDNRPHPEYTRIDRPQENHTCTEESLPSKSHHRLAMNSRQPVLPCQKQQEAQLHITMAKLSVLEPSTHGSRSGAPHRRNRLLRPSSPCAC